MSMEKYLLSNAVNPGGKSSVNQKLFAGISATKTASKQVLVTSSDRQSKCLAPNPNQLTWL